MKNRIYALLIGAAFTLATCGASHGMSELLSMTMEPVSPTPHQPANVFLYEITVERAGQGLLKVELSSEGLPTGATVTFSPSVVRFTGRAPTTKTAIMTITYTNSTPANIYTFTVTGEARRESITITDQIALGVMGITQGLPVLILDRLPGDAVQIRGLGTSDQIYQIESTPDLINPVWTPIGSATANLNGIFTFVVANISDTPMQFFRAVYPTPAPALERCSGLPKP